MIRALAEAASVPVRWQAAREAMPPPHHTREWHTYLRRLTEVRGSFARATDLVRIAAETFDGRPQNQWIKFLLETLDSWRIESDDAELPVQSALEFLYETSAETRREFSWGDGVVLSTVHAAKGLEFRVVVFVGMNQGTFPHYRSLDSSSEVDEERRNAFVAVTRAGRALVLSRPLTRHTRYGPRRQDRSQFLDEMRLDERRL